MKRIVSVSLGSSKRDKVAHFTVLGEEVTVERVGTNGSMKEAIKLVQELDGKVDAFGMGGIDLYIWAGDRRYTFRDAKKIARAARLSPMLDGSGLKNTLERRVVEYLLEQGYRLKGKKVLMVSAVDRFGMAEALDAAGCEMVFGDLMFGLGVPIAVRSLKGLYRLARIIAPIATQLPFAWLYPTGEKQEKSEPKFVRYYQEADIIAGDWLFIKRHMPPRLDGKVVLTNTVTEADIQDLRERGATTIITTTPNLSGRSFGTNLMEALIVAFDGRGPGAELTAADYMGWLDRLEFKPRVEQLNPPTLESQWLPARPATASPN